MTTIPSTSPAGAWKRGLERRAGAVTQPVVSPNASGHHTHASDDGDMDGHGSHEHGDVTDRLDEHHERLLNLEKGNAAKAAPAK
jgi:hypothetical protein